MPGPRKLITLRQAAKLTGKSRPLISHWVKHEHLESFEVIWRGKPLTGTFVDEHAVILLAETNESTDR